LSVEEEALQAIAESSFDSLWKISQDVRRRSAPDENDLNPIAGSFDDELEIAEGAAMGPVSVGGDAGFSDGLPNLEAGLVDEGVMNQATRNMNDAMAVGLEESDLGITGVSTYGQTCAMAMAQSAHSMDARIRNARGHRDLEKARPCVFR
jgi:hypothetical protein